MSVDLSYSETGDGPALIILHGLFGWKRNWAGIAKALSDDFRVLTLDLRNHGDSPHAPDMSYEAMAEDVAAFIVRQNLGPVPLVGHSMGGKAAMTLALSQPAMVERLLVLDIAPLPYERDYDRYIAALRSLDVSTTSQRSAIDKSLEAQFPDRSIRAFLMQNLVKDAEGCFNWRINLDAIERHMDDIMGFPEIDSDDAYDGQTLFLAGSDSDYISLSHQAEIERLFPNAEMDVIDGAGHWVHADQPTLFVERLASFLSVQISTQDD